MNDVGRGPAGQRPAPFSYEGHASGVDLASPSDEHHRATAEQEQHAEPADANCVCAGERQPTGCWRGCSGRASSKDLIVVLDVRPDVRPVAVSVWVPVRLAPKTTTCRKAPLVSAADRGVLGAVVQSDVTVSPGRKPWPQNVTLDLLSGSDYSPLLWAEWRMARHLPASRMSPSL